MQRVRATSRASWWPSKSDRLGRLELARVAGLDDAHDVGFLHDQQFLTIDLDFGAGPLAEQHLVALLDVERRQLTGLVAPAGPYGDDLALLRLLLGGVRNDDAGLRLLLAFEATDDDAVMQGTELHVSASYLD